VSGRVSSFSINCDVFSSAPMKLKTFFFSTLYWMRICGLGEFARYKSTYNFYYFYYCDFPRLHHAAVGIRAWRRHHLVPWEKFRLDSYVGVASERISHGWVNGSSSEKVGMRHEFGFQFEFREFRQVQSITNSEFGVQYFGSIQFRRRGVKHSSCAICGARTSTV